MVSRQTGEVLHKAVAMAGRMRTKLLTATLLAALIAGAATLALLRAPVLRPDVLLVTVDTLRSDALEPYGSPEKTSPNVARLADEGVVFGRAIAASAATAPSHATIFTSRWVRGHTVAYYNGPTRLDDVSTLAETFKKNGYDTAAFVGNVMLHRRSGFDRGFNVYDDELPAPEINRPEMFERLAPETTERAVAWLGRPRQRPVFVWVHYQDPHGPYTPPAEHVERFKDVIDTTESPLPIIDGTMGTDGIPAYQAIPGLLLPSEYRARYLGEVSFFDSMFGVLMSSFDGRDNDREKIVLFTSDHGEAFGEAKVYFSHGHAKTPDQAHVPFILRAPGIDPGERTDPVAHVDIMPTLLDLAGLEKAPSFDGIALGPYLKTGQALPDRPIFCDIGLELSTYWQGRFVRLRLLQESPDSPYGPNQPSAAANYAWRADGSWERLEGTVKRPPELSAYMMRRVRTLPAKTPTSTEIEQLKVLGYIRESETTLPSDR
jgi:arylsulfatase A-like enzyme